MLTAIDGPTSSVLLGGTCGHRESPIVIYRVKGPSVHIKEFLVEQAALILPRQREYAELIHLWVQHALG